MAIFDHTMQFKLLTLSQHYNYSRQGVRGITVNVFMVYLSKASTKIHYSLLITHYSEYKHPKLCALNFDTIRQPIIKYVY